VPGTELSVVCEGVLSRIFRPRNEDGNGRGLVVALTSAHPAAGVSYITKALATALDQHGHEITLLLNGRHLGEVDRKPALAPQNLGPDPRRDNWYSYQSRLALYLADLRREYRYVLIDCPSVKESEHAVVLAPLVDGIVVVVEANRTRKDQLLYTERTLKSAGGRILGHVLNKRTYVIPEWFHRKMEAIGI
jgi:Mrp family chromosome partitioning ATPase